MCSRVTHALLSMLLLAALLSQIAFAYLPGAKSPPGSFLVTSDAGTALYRIGYSDGYSGFVQLAHLNQGAAVKVLHGAIIDPGTGQGVYGGDNPGFSTQILQEVWHDFSARHPNTFCITNGQFFSAHASMARVPFPLKVDGKVVSDGYGLNEFPNEKLMLEIWPDRADIVPLSATALYTSSAPNIVAGLSQEASGRRPNRPTGRTFIGVGDPGQHGNYETILIFTSSIARKTEAASVLRSFGAEKVMMLDGGASTQLTCRGENYISSSRRIPQTIAVMAAVPETTPQPAVMHRSRTVSCEMEALPLWPHTSQHVSINLWC